MTRSSSAFARRSTSDVLMDIELNERAEAVARREGNWDLVDALGNAHDSLADELHAVALRIAEQGA